MILRSSWGRGSVSQCVFGRQVEQFGGVKNLGQPVSSFVFTLYHSRHNTNLDLERLNRLCIVVSLRANSSSPGNILYVQSYRCFARGHIKML